MAGQLGLLSPHAYRNTYRQAAPPMVQPHIDHTFDLHSATRIFGRGSWHRALVVPARIDPGACA
jgi:hypothetical protein